MTAIAVGASSLCSGIYEIRNRVSGHRYIGQSANISRRWKEHLKTLRSGNSHQPHLQSAWNKYGPDAFEFHILGQCGIKHLTFFEQAWMDARRPEYNKAPAAGSPLGIKRSLETREKVAAANRGRKQSAETRAKRAVALRGNTHTLGHVLTAVHKAKISESLRASAIAFTSRQAVHASNRGRVHTPEARANMATAARLREAKKRLTV